MGGSTKPVDAALEGFLRAAGDQQHAEAGDGLPIQRSASDRSAATR